MSLPPYSFKHLMSIISSSKIATLFKFVSTVLFHLSSAILDFMEVTADYSFPDFLPFPVPRSPFPVLVTSLLKLKFSAGCTMRSVKDAIAYGLRKAQYKDAREHQRKVIEGYCSGKDVFLSAPT